MSKKRNKNKRKKQPKKNRTKRPVANRTKASAVLEKLGFEITRDPIGDEDFQNLPADVQEQMEELYYKSQSNSMAAIKELQDLLLKYPHIPKIYNFLYGAYMHAGEKTKAIQIMEENYAKNPTYLFARLNYSDYLVEIGELKKAAEIYDYNFDLKSLYPKRSVFHITEVISFFGIIGYYHAMVGNYDEARKCLSVLTAISPHHDYTLRLKHKINRISTLIA